MTHMNVMGEMKLRSLFAIWKGENGLSEFRFTLKTSEASGLAGDETQEAIV
jgi:hypothetical protein